MDHQFEEFRFLFGSKAIEIDFGYDPIRELLEKELSLYKKTSIEPDIKIRFVKQLDLHVKSENPRSHRVVEGGFWADFGWYSVAWHQKGQSISIEILLKRKLRDYLRKALSIQFCHPFEGLGQILHEIVLIPSLMMFSSRELTLIHGCALESPDGHGVIIGGTGGAGKTAAAVSLILRKNFKFLSDDISILDRSGNIWANNAYPKIYGYNVQNDPEVGTKIFSTMGLIDRIHWSIHIKRSASKVRRRVDPGEFYDGKTAEKTKLRTFYMLYKGDYDSPSFEKIDPEKIVEMNLSIMHTEYNVIHNQLYWNNFNLVANAEKPISIDMIYSNWETLQKRIFATIECVLVRIPLEFTAEPLQEYITEIVSQ